MEAFLRKIPLFADLPEEDLKRLCEMAEEVRLAPGQVLFEEGSPGDRAYVILEGELEVIKASPERDVLLAARGPGEVIGEMALLENQSRIATVRAKTESVLLTIHFKQLEHLLMTSYSAGRTMFYTILGRWQAMEALLRQSEKMVQLGILTAGITHELNNPAAAVKRGAEQLQDALAQYGQAQFKLGQIPLTKTQERGLRFLEDRARGRAARPISLTPLERRDREEALENWLDGHGVPVAWECAPALVNLDYSPDELSALAQHVPPKHLALAVEWLNTTYTVYTLLAELGQGAVHISDIVKALKTYSYLDQAPVQEVDVHEGLDNTLLLLRHKLKSGIIVRQEYAPDLPKIQAYGSELNQVWTNIIDNAADALAGQGQIIVRTRQENDWLIVEVEDDGPGIPIDIQPRLFDPFFTTKPPGVGTGLGLDISHNIVVHKHRGDIKVFSEAGKTCFQVWLPLNFDEQRNR